jgi:hypothetical protein
MSASAQQELIDQVSPRAEDEDRALVTMRVPSDVVRLVDQDRADKSCPSRPRYLADLVCHLYGSADHAHGFDLRKEQLQLAINARHKPAA